MKKMFLVALLFTGCTSVDDKGRLEKVRIAVPAFFQIEMDYYKDKENFPKGTIKTNTPPKIGNPCPKLMEMTPK